MIRVIIIEDVEYMVTTMKNYLQQGPAPGRQDVEIVGVFKHPDEMFAFLETDKQERMPPVDIITFDALYSASGDKNPDLSECRTALERLATLRHEIPCLKHTKAILISQNERILRLLPDVWPLIHGCINKDDLRIELDYSVQHLSRSGMGNTYFPRYDLDVTKIKEALLKTGPNEFWNKVLSSRQAEILNYLLDGWTNDRISDRLEIAKSNVSTKVGEIFTKLANYSAHKALYLNDNNVSKSIAIFKLCIELKHPRMLEILKELGV